MTEHKFSFENFFVPFLPVIEKLDNKLSVNSLYNILLIIDFTLLPPKFDKSFT